MSLAITAQAAEQQSIDLGERSAAEWNQVIAVASKMTDPGSKIDLLSSVFLNTSYLENSLIGSSERDEVLVMNLTGVDCFTLLDYVESFRRSDKFSAVIDSLKQVRYQNGQIAYLQRNHFFSDWQQRNVPHIIDVTVAVGQGKTVTVSKQLNRKQDGSYWLEGIPVTTREIVYIPADQINGQVIDVLRTGDYVGIYSRFPGLDVSHTGIIIKVEGRTLLRHATSQESMRKVVEVDFLEYLEGKPGLVVYRGR